MKVAFQGEAGAFSEQAVFEYFGSVESTSCESFEAVFDAINSGKCEAGIIPIENSLAGSIHQNYDLLLRNNLHIVGEYLLRVRHCLIANPGVKKADIKKAVSHPQALGQCAGYLRSHKIKAGQGLDTAGSVKALKESGALDTAAIASRRAAEYMGCRFWKRELKTTSKTTRASLQFKKNQKFPNVIPVRIVQKHPLCLH